MAARFSGFVVVTLCFSVGYVIFLAVNSVRSAVHRPERSGNRVTAAIPSYYVSSFGAGRVDYLSTSRGRTLPVAVGGLRRGFSVRNLSEFTVDFPTPIPKIRLLQEGRAVV